MEQIHKDQNLVTRATDTQVLVSILGDKKDVPLAAAITSEVWAAGISAQMLVNKRETKHFDFAKANRIPLMVIVDKRERKEGDSKKKNASDFKLIDVEAASDEPLSRFRLIEELLRPIQGKNLPEVMPTISKS